MPRGTRKFRFSFEETHLTHFGGMWLIQRFCKRLKLRWLLQKYVDKLQRTVTYHPAELMVALLFAIIMGLRRINKTDILQYNGAFLEMLGLERFPDQSTLRRFLKRLAPKSIRQLVRLHDSLRAYLFALPLSAQLPRLRCGCHGPYYLRSSRRRSRGIQPEKAGPQVLPSLALLRSRFPGVLAWELAPGQRWRLHGCRALPQSLSGQGPFDHRPLAHALSHGLGLLRQPCYSVPGRLGMRLCDGGAGSIATSKHVPKDAASKRSATVGRSPSSATRCIAT